MDIVVNPKAMMDYVAGCVLYCLELEVTDVSQRCLKLIENMSNGGAVREKDIEQIASLPVSGPEGPSTQLYSSINSYLLKERGWMFLQPHSDVTTKSFRDLSHEESLEVKKNKYAGFSVSTISV